MYWTYGVDGRWIAPQIARIELAGLSAVYKLYAIIDETRIPAGQATIICADFLKALLPEFDRAVLDKQFLAKDAGANATTTTSAGVKPAPLGDEENVP